MRIVEGKKRCIGPRAAQTFARPLCQHRATDIRRRFLLVRLEAENDSGRHSQIVLVQGVIGAQFIEASQQVIDLQRTNGEARADAVINSAAYGHRKRILAIGSVEQACAGVRDAEQHFSERGDAAEVTVGNARTKKVRRKRAIQAAGQTIGGVVSAEISDST